MSNPFVVVGANLAGGRAVEALRQEGFDGPLVLVGEEPHRPYERPPLSKGILQGREGVSYLRPADWYARHDIDLRLGVRCTELDPAGSVVLSTGEIIAFDGCVLATGGRPRRLDVQGIDLDGVHYLRSLDDARSLADALVATPRVVVIGAGFIGAEVAASARTVGCDVTMLEVLPVPLQRVLGDDLGAVYAAIHRDHGVDLRTSEGVERLVGDGRVEGVVGTSGTTYPADLVVVGVGMEPNVELAAEAGLACDNGITVDGSLRTAAPTVFAVGDVANRGVRTEHFQSAERQGLYVATAMLGSDEPYAEVPWFWSDQYDVNLQTLGHPSAEAERVTRGSMEDRTFTTIDVTGERITGAVAVNSPGDIGALRRIMERDIPVDARVLADPDTSLRSLVR